jgi:TPR repeat protein
LCRPSLGVFYKEGIATEKDEIKAYFWFLLAFRQAHENAKAEIDLLNKTLTIDTIEKITYEAKIKEKQINVWKSASK